MPPAANSGDATHAWASGTAAIARLLIAADRPLTVEAIADAAGLTPSRTSQVLSRLRQEDAAWATAGGYVGDTPALLDLYRRRSHAPVAHGETYWVSRRPLLEQAQRLLQQAKATGTRCAFSADLGTDLLNVGGRPTAAIVYTDRKPLAGASDFVRAERRTDASLIVRWTSNTTLLTPAPPWPAELDGVPLADPVQQWSDLHDLGGDDRHEAADRLRDAIIRRALPRTA